MTEVNNTNTTININLDTTLGISDTEAANLVQTLNNKLVGDGIESVSYVNGQLEVEGTGISVDTLAAKLQSIVFSSNEVKAFLGEDVKDVTFKQNLDGTITLTTTAAQGTSSVTKSISDFDIRELMKLLIGAFAELRTADRDRALNVLNSVVNAFEAKISQMETAKDEQYKAAMVSAIGQIAGGIITVCGGIIGSACSGASASKAFKADKKKKDLDTSLKQGNVNMSNGDSQLDQVLNPKQLKLSKKIENLQKSSSRCGTAGQFFSSTAISSGQMASGIASWIAAADTADKAQADIEVTKADQLLEILKQAQDQYTKGNDSLQQFIDKILSIMQQLLQSASQTEKSVANI